ncbi:hypothetical protein [Haloparvum sedimenti]|nr:hypothetical protein [Haloparvum sedimenti]
MDLDALDGDAFRAVAGVGVGYGLILAAILVVLFLVPYLLFLTL